jgi:hypothetical protein
MAAFVLFVVAVAGGGVAADLALENPTAGQVTVFGQTVGGYPEGWLLAAAAGLGFVVALVLVASVNSTKGRRAPQAACRSAAGPAGPGGCGRAESCSPAGWVLRP